jgi:hypothetical protein
MGIGEAMCVFSSALLIAGMFQVENLFLTYFDDIFYEVYAIVRRPKLVVLLNAFQLAIIT